MSTYTQLSPTEAAGLTALLDRVGPTTLFAAIGVLCELKVEQARTARDTYGARHWGDMSLEFSRLERVSRNAFGR
jgi:hypothetical protein